ncbi:MAG: threonine aldolase, partial [Anaerolineae bacterium]|nr:threonine aldolase [Anaerolineae bacterium]
MSDRDRTAIYRACTRFLPGSPPQTIREVFTELAAYAPAEAVPDMYGSGAVIEDFEAQIAELLGKPAAVFLPSGTMAQQIALRIWAERSGRCTVAFHPTCHLDLHEQDAYRILHNLRSVRAGNQFRLLTLDDLQAVKEPLVALLIELPQRHIGGALPTWEELSAIADWARERRIVLHMDGARLWECGPFYARPYAEIAALFDSVYVSFYKTLGGITGAALAGPEDVIAEAKVWQRRHGGNLIRLYPYVLSAQYGLEHRLPRMAA